MVEQEHTSLICVAALPPGAVAPALSVQTAESPLSRLQDRGGTLGPDERSITRGCAFVSSAPMR